jgi:hypothetical protein
MHLLLLWDDLDLENVPLYIFLWDLVVMSLLVLLLLPQVVLIFKQFLY